MLIVVVIIGILAAALIPRLSSVKDKANDSGRKSNLQQLVTAYSSYVLDNGVSVTWGDAATVYSGMLKLGGMTSIPSDPNNKSTNIFGVTTTWYAILPVSRGNGSGFIVAARAETAGAANWVQSNLTQTTANGDFTGGTNMDTITLCSTVKEAASFVNKCEWPVANFRIVSVY